MTALAADKNTVRMGRPLGQAELPMKANTEIFQGAGVVDDAGYAAPARTATGLITKGVAVYGVDNNPGANGALKCAVESGDFLFVNDGADPVLQANVGGLCYWTDDQTVSITATGKSVAGRVEALNPTGYTGVVVRVGVIPGS